MSGKAFLCYGEEFGKYRFGPDHPFNPLRLETTVDLIKKSGMLQDAMLLRPRTAAREELLLVHDEHYLQAVEAAGLEGKAGSECLRYNLATEDNPVFSGMHQAAGTVVGSSIKAAKLIMEKKADHVFNIAGGLHHAARDHASGFCIYNDASAAIAVLRELGARVLYIDTDAHHGDGVQWTFYEDPNVLTFSIHESGRYLFPGTGHLSERGRGEGYGYAVNVPLEAFTEDDSYMEILRQILPRLLEAFRPDIIVSQHGCDGHEFDPLTHLALTTKTYREIPRLIHRLAHEFCEGRLLALGGGGYDLWRVVPRAWAMLWAEISDRKIPEQIPADWLESWQDKSPFPLMTTFLDPPEMFPPKAKRAEREEKNRAAVRRIFESHPLFLR